MCKLYKQLAKLAINSMKNLHAFHQSKIICLPCVFYKSRQQSAVFLCVYFDAEFLFLCNCSFITKWNWLQFEMHLEWICYKPIKLKDDAAVST